MDASEPMKCFIGYDLRESDKASELLDLLKLSSGRSLKAGDQGKVVLGSTLAKKYNVKVGDTVDLKNTPFEVIGINEPTLSSPDQFAFVSYEDVLTIFKAD